MQQLDSRRLRRLAYDVGAFGASRTTSANGRSGGHKDHGGHKGRGDHPTPEPDSSETDSSESTHLNPISESDSSESDSYESTHLSPIPESDSSDPTHDLIKVTTEF